MSRLSLYTAPTKTTSVPFSPNGIYYGTVNRTDESTNRVWVQIPRISLSAEFGPITVADKILPAVGARVACLFVENDTENVVVVGQFLSVGDVSDSPVVVTLSTVSEVAIRSFSATKYRSAKFLVQAVQGSNLLLTELLVIHDGTTAYFTEYGRVVAGTAPATFDVDIEDGEVRLKATPASSSSTVFKILTTAIPL